MNSISKTKGNKLIRGLGLMLIVWLLFVAAYASVIRSHAEDAGLVAVLSLLGGTFSYAFLLQFVGFFTAVRDRGAIHRAMKGQPPVDGKLAAASGPVKAMGELLSAPFTGRPCVAYDYRVQMRGGAQSDFWGVRMAPCAIETSQGLQRILGWVQLDEVPSADRKEMDVPRGLDYLKSVRLEKFGVPEILSVLRELTSDDDGSISKDYMTSGAEFDFSASQMGEKILSAGEMVTVIGFWSAARGGFVSAGTTAMNRIFLCDLQTTLKKLQGTTIIGFAVTFFLFIAVHALISTMY